MKKNRLLSNIIISVLIGALSGFAAGTISNSYFQKIYDASLGEINFSNGNYRGSNLVIRDPGKVVVQENDMVQQTLNSVQSSLVGIIDNSKNKIDDKKLSDFYRADESAGQGFIMTSDGWILTNFKIDKSGDYSVVTSDDKIYPIDKIVTDKLTPFYFIHISALDLPVRKFADPTSINTGETALVANWNGNDIVTSVKNANVETHDNLTRSSDGFYTSISLADNPDGGLVVLDLAGNVIGFNRGGQIEPIYHLTAAFQSLLTYKEIKRPSLGVNYINYSDLVPLKSTSNLDYKGALIYKDKSGIAVVSGSSASAVGLKEGDTILAVDNTNIDQNDNLTDVIQGYNAGDTVMVTYLRNGVKNQIAVKLGELK